MTRHRIDVISLIFAVVFSLVALLALADALAPSGAVLRWAGAGALVVIGIALLATARTAGRDDDEPSETHDIS